MRQWCALLRLVGWDEGQDVRVAEAFTGTAADLAASLAWENGGVAFGRRVR